MNSEAQDLLAQKVRELRRLSYEDLRRRMGRVRWSFGSWFRLIDGGGVEVEELVVPSGWHYARESEAFWDGEEGGDVRVSVTIRDERGKMVAAEDFIIAPDGSFVDD